MTFAASLAMIGAGLWVWLVLFRGLYWQDDFSDAPEEDAPDTAALDAPSVVAILPLYNAAGARRPKTANEIDKAQLEKTLGKILRQKYPSRLQIIIVDGLAHEIYGGDTGDLSKRRTEFAAWLREQAKRHLSENGDPTPVDEKVKIIAANLVPSQWSERLWGLSQGLIEARQFASPAVYAWWVDAETDYDPGALSQMVRVAESEPRHLVSILPAHNCHTRFECLAVPAYGYFFRLLYPFAWVANSEHELAAAGRCILVRRSSLDAVGGLSATWGYSEENALAAAIKPQGGIRVMLSHMVRAGAHRSRLSEIRQLLARDELIRGEDNPLAQMMTALVLLLGFVLPPWFGLFGTGTVSVMGFLAWGAMSLSYIPMLNFYRLSPFWAPTLPLPAMLYLFSLIESMMSRWTRPNK
ncbi:MAG: glycosyltransferase [Candidatus Symbiobacter sp.]|nr:glycosyltransferase [Candidatus Symbiobacter sp.]